MVRALELARQAVSNQPDDFESHYIKAVSLRLAAEFENALTVLETSLSLKPDFASAHQEQGHNYLALKKVQDAFQAYTKAVQINPTLAASWNGILKTADEKSNAPVIEEAKNNLQGISATPPELLKARSLFFEKSLSDSEELCRAYLQRNKTDVQGMRLLAAIAFEYKIYDDSELLLETILEIDPSFHAARQDYLRVLLKRHLYLQSLTEAEKLLSFAPENINIRVGYAHALSSLNRFEDAITEYDKALKIRPDMSSALLSRGHSLKTIGQSARAIDSYQQVTTLPMGFGEAFWSLANLKTYQFEKDEIERMLALAEREDNSLPDQYNLSFALGKAMEDIKDYERSFHYYKKGNQLKLRETNYRRDGMTADISKQISTFTPSLFEKLSDAGSSSKDPIFIIGLPRAGSTLLEQILASHSLVDGTKELPNIIAMAHRLGGRRSSDKESLYPQILEELPIEEFKQLGEKYIADTKVQRGKAPYFIDKMPNNFRHVGLIHLILPNAKIIDARRNPMDCCFSNFKQLFAEGQEFTYGLPEIAQYYHDYIQLMNHYDEVFPGRVLRVQHEDVLDNLEEQVHRILDYCDLPFEEACLNFHQNKRAVRTASSEQVREPINLKGVGRWNPYKDYLSPLSDYLIENRLWHDTDLSS